MKRTSNFDNSTKKIIHRRVITNRSVGPHTNASSQLSNLTARIKQLEKENSELKEYNKKLLYGEDDSTHIPSNSKKHFSFDSPTDVHTFYQDVFITDLNKEINCMNEEKDVYKKQISGLAMVIEFF
jgi:predicted nuclease with TOPRIM domain